MRATPLGITLGLTATLAACEVGPNYHRPATPQPAAFKESKGWVPANPSDAADKQDWWTVFGDQQLNDLETQVATSNQTLAAAEAAYRQAHQLVAEQRAQLFPTVSLNGSANATGGGGGSVNANANAGNGGNGVNVNLSRGGVTQSYRVELGGTWEPDLWGKIRRGLENAKANAQASAADVANARLSAETELAADYIQLRQFDQLNRLYGDTVTAYQQSLTITQNKYKAGNVALSDVRQAETQLYNARATYTDIAQQRAKDEHAIAILVGKAPADLTIAPAPWTLKPLDIPPGLPSTLLERRPDVAGAERRAAAASANVGVQVAAYFPTLDLSASGGSSVSKIAQLFSAPSLFWTVGATAAETIFDAGLRHAQVGAARAAYDEAVANYRQSVLSALGQVEDNLAAQRVLAAEQTDRRAAASAAEDTVRIFRNEYQAGTIDYTNVVVAQAAALATEESELTLEAARLTTTVDLIAALGGGWNAAQLPTS
jgi:NodT family efflux transporter outer membrane factor (OMF) lipoprotein